MTDAFFEHDRGSRFIAGPYTRGPWDPLMQHGGPPSALIARAITDVDPIEGQQLARITFEILRPVPIGAVHVKARLARPGKKVAMAEAVLTDDDGQELMLARGWRIQPTPVEVAGPKRLEPPAPLGEPGATDWFVDDDAPGFSKGVEVRFSNGGFTKIGPGTAWFRLAIPFVGGTPDRPSDTLFVAADCGNGISAEIDFSRYVFVNPDLSVFIERLPVGPWVCLDAKTFVTPGGVTNAVSTLFDEQGRVARGSQTLFVASR